MLGEKSKEIWFYLVTYMTKDFTEFSPTAPSNWMVIMTVNIL